jgi:hypothetical protein
MQSDPPPIEIASAEICTMLVSALHDGSALLVEARDLS